MNANTRRDAGRRANEVTTRHGRDSRGLGGSGIPCAASGQTANCTPSTVSAWPRAGSSRRRPPTTSSARRTAAHWRQRTNRKAGGATMAALPPPKIPPIPNPDRRRWHALTRIAWEHAWTSPMASQWLETDADALGRLALLWDDFYRRPSAD